MLNTSILKVINSTPVLNLDFANAQRLDSRISFSRSSRGTYVASNRCIKLAPVNSPRFDHDFYTGKSKGLLIEESRTNLVSYSAYDASAWINNFPAGATLTTGIDAPDGTNTAIRFACNNTTNALLRVTIPALTPNGTDNYTTSFWVRKISGTGQATTDLGDDNPYKDYSSELITDKWIRIYATGVPTATEKTWVDIFSDKNTNYVLDFWGVQLELGAYPTSYIPTSGATATRSADIAFMSSNNFSNWYNQNQGSLFVNANSGFTNSTNLTAKDCTVFSINDGTNDNSIDMTFYGAAPPGYKVISGFTTSGTFTGAGNSTAIGINENFKAAINFKSQDSFKFAYNGNLDSTLAIITGISSLPTVNQMSIGCGATNFASGFLNSTISKISYYSNVLSDVDLQNITT
jgi:hypothetical protein